LHSSNADLKEHRDVFVFSVALQQQGLCTNPLGSGTGFDGLTIVLVTEDNVFVRLLRGHPGTR
jgi:hypothetical protein